MSVVRSEVCMYELSEAKVCTITGDVCGEACLLHSLFKRSYKHVNTITGGERVLFLTSSCQFILQWYHSDVCTAQDIIVIVRVDNLCLRCAVAHVFALISQ